MTTEFTRVCDIWKSFWEALAEEVVTAGGHTDMLERLAKRDLKPAIASLARTLVGLATPRVAGDSPTPVIFNPKKAKEAWPSATLWENPQLPYCTFTWKNAQNGTKLHVAINYMNKQIQVELDLTTLDCPTLGQSNHKLYQHLMHLALRAGVIGGVGYHPAEQYIEFLLTPVEGTPHRRLYISDKAFPVFTDWK
jgi:hypothetical protein